jgi:hypothetical protein
MLNLRGRTGEFRIAAAVLFVSLVVLVISLPDSCSGGYEPIWQITLSAFTFTIAFIWLLILFFESRKLDRLWATVYAVSCHVAIGFAAWGLSEAFVGRATPDQDTMHQSFVWIPFWIVGALLGTDFFNICAD